MIFISAPFTGPKELIDSRMGIVYKYFASLCEQGKHAVSPLLVVPIMDKVTITQSHDFWLPYSDDLIRRCDELHVLSIDRWDESTGVKFEISRATLYGLPISFVDPTTFVATPLFDGVVLL